ncbi:MAG: ribosomal RNA small subunit methyltransferase A [Candidatus Cloacimonetes bacterium]|nr:ribosomal RNA small subunit methyltransferase A [Candidatus Cloacimonadota bacterium]
MNIFRQKKSLGQHFLLDPNLLRKIVKLAEILPDEHVWEIGPGKGTLTRELLKTGCRLTLFEIDRELVQYLHDMLPPEVTVIQGDVLKSDWQKLFPETKIKIVSNLPFQISTPLLFRLAQASPAFSRIVLMLQKELAQRIRATAGTADYGLLSLKMQYYFSIKYAFTVKKHLFKPPPRVDAAVLVLHPRVDSPILTDPDFFWSIVTATFGNRRKILGNNLKKFLSLAQLRELGRRAPEILVRRAETLTEMEFVHLVEQIRRITGLDSPEDR